MNTEIVYRSANVSDWDQLAKFRNIYSEEGIEVAKIRFKEDFVDDPRKERSEIFLAQLNNKIVGYGRSVFFDPKVDSQLYGLRYELPEGVFLRGVLTHEKVRGMGVGVKLTKLRIEWAKTRSDRIFCYLQDSNIPSVKMHEKLGFVLIKRGLKYPSDNNGNHLSGVLFELKF